MTTSIAFAAISRRLALFALLALGATSPTRAGETITFFHNDVAGSPAVATDVNGIQAWKENYRPYGDQLIDSSAAQNNKLWFAGKSFDDSTGLSYMGARYYDPTLGRFMAVDPVSFDLGNLHSFNRYTYANNNPYKYVDPDGREAATAQWLQQTTDFINAFPPAAYVGAGELMVNASPGVGDYIAVVDAIEDPSAFNIITAGIGVIPLIGDAASGTLKTAANMAEIAAKGKAGEAITRAKLGDKIAGEQVTFKTSDGTTTRPDFVTTDKGIVETKTGNATLSPGQAKLKADIEAGRQVTPVGQNAAKAGLKPGEPTRMSSCKVDRPC